MKTLHATALAITLTICNQLVFSQEKLAPDQNPRFAESRDKYMKLTDSINRWHGTTFQETYKAFDWYEARQERRQERLDFRREMKRMRLNHRYRYQPYNSRPYYNRNYRNHWMYWYF